MDFRVKWETSCVQQFEIYNICMDSEFLNEGEGGDVILRIFDTIIELLCGKNIQLYQYQERTKVGLVRLYCVFYQAPAKLMAHFSSTLVLLEV